MRLLGISIGTLLIAFLIGVILRLWGLALPYRKFEHPFFGSPSAALQISPVFIPILSPKHFAFSPGHNPLFLFKPESSRQNPKIIWINIYITADKKLISDFGFDIDAFLTWTKDKNKFKGKYLHSYTIDELSSFWSEIVSLDSVIKTFPKSQFVFNVLSNDIDIHKEVVAFVEANSLADRIMINSTIDIIIKAIKEIRPMWIYGTSISEVSRVKSFSTLYLEPAISVRGDVFVAPLTYLARKLADEQLVNEMKRRKKYVFLGPLLKDEEMKLAEDLHPDAIVY